ncbi:hypothetical protein EBT31_21685 [bacterium]|nr:hypothetical protein [bacterium]
MLLLYMIGCCTTHREVSNEENPTPLPLPSERYCHTAQRDAGFIAEACEGASVPLLTRILGAPVTGGVDELLIWCFDGGSVYNGVARDTSFTASTPQIVCVTGEWAHVTGWRMEQSMEVWGRYTGEARATYSEDSYGGSSVDVTAEEGMRLSGTSSLVGSAKTTRVVVSAAISPQLLSGEVCAYRKAPIVFGDPVDVVVPCDPDGFRCADGEYIGKLAHEWVSGKLHETGSAYYAARDGSGNCYLVRPGDLCVGE